MATDTTPTPDHVEDGTPLPWMDDLGLPCPWSASQECASVKLDDYITMGDLRQIASRSYGDESIFDEEAPGLAFIPQTLREQVLSILGDPDRLVPKCLADNIVRLQRSLDRLSSDREYLKLPAVVLVNTLARYVSLRGQRYGAGASAANIPIALSTHRRFPSACKDAFFDTSELDEFGGVGFLSSFTEAMVAQVFEANGPEVYRQEPFLTYLEELGHLSRCELLSPGDDDSSSLANLLPSELTELFLESLDDCPPAHDDDTNKRIQCYLVIMNTAFRYIGDQL